MKVWDADKGHEVRALKGRLKGVTCVAWSPDGKRILSGDHNSIQVLNAQDGQEELLLEGNQLDVCSVAVSPHGGMIVSGTQTDPLKVWDAQTGRELFKFKADGSAEGFSAKVAISPDGLRVASCGSDGYLRVGDPKTGQILHKLTGHTKRVTCVAFGPDGKRIVSGSADGSLKVWDVEKGEKTLTFKGQSVKSLAWNRDGSRIVCGTWERNRGLNGNRSILTGTVWDTENAQQLFSLNEPDGSVPGVAFSPDKRRLVTSAIRHQRKRGSPVPIEHHELKVWDAASGQEVVRLKGHTARVHSVAWSPDGNRILTGSWDKTAKVWDADKGHEVLHLKGHTDRVTCVAWSPDGNRIVSGSSDTLKVWDAVAGQETLSLKGHTGSVNSVAWSPDGKRIVSGSSDDRLKVWDAGKGLELLSLRGHTSWWVNSLAWSPDGNRIASASTDSVNLIPRVGTVKVWDGHMIQEGLSRRCLSEEEITSAAFSPDGQLIFGEGASGKIFAWSAHTGQPFPHILQQMPPGPSRTTLPDGRFLRVSGRTIHLVDPAQEQANQAHDRASLQRLARFDPAFHLARLAEAERGGNAFAAAFHRRRLLGEQPWNPDWHVLEAHAQARLGHRREAITHLMHALFLNPRVPLQPVVPPGQ